MNRKKKLLVEYPTLEEGSSLESCIVTVFGMMAGMVYMMLEIPVGIILAWAIRDQVTAVSMEVGI